MSRMRAALLNSSVASIGQVLTIIAQFVARTFFIRILGQEFLGLNGLFVNILSVLNFAELGIGSAITYSLYEPLAHNNRPQVAALMQLFKRWYQYIAGIVLVGGLIVTPLLPLLIKDNNLGFTNVYVAFLLSLSNTVASYLVSYKRTLLIANQQGYLNVINTVGFSLIQQILQVILLLIIPNYYIYLIIQLVFMLLSNIRISRVVDKRFPYLEQYKSTQVEPGTLKYFKKNMIGMVSAKLGGVVATGTDNILLSFFVGLHAVGMYSNYTLILNGLTSILNQAITSVSSSIGNFSVESRKKHDQQKVFYGYYNLCSFISLFVAVGFTAFSSTFIRYWVGPQFVYLRMPLFLVSLNFFLQMLRQPLITYTNALGLYWYERYKPIFESIVNLAISLILVSTTKLGISAVLIGTISSNIFVNYWWEPLIVFRWGLGDGYYKFMLLNTLYIIIGIICIGIPSYLSSMINSGNILVNVMNTIMSEIVSTFIFWLFAKLASPYKISLSFIVKRIKLR